MKPEMACTFTLLVLFALPASANELSDLLESQSESERAASLGDVLSQSGKSCGEVTRTFLQSTDRDDAAYWNVQCSNGSAYNIQVPADPAAKTRIMECELMDVIGVPCFKKMED